MMGTEQPDYRGLMGGAIKAGLENLDVLCWAIDSGLPIDEVLEILEALDINSRRIECQLEERLTRGY